MNFGNPVIRLIEKNDNPALKQIIEAVMPEFGASGDGFAIKDPEVQAMFEKYSQDRHIYYVIEIDGRVTGGCGIAPLLGGEVETCELQKMYFLKETRGHGLGNKIINLCLERAREMGFTGCYIETLNNMNAAKKLYLKNGFKPLTQAMGKTGHFGCDLYYFKKL